MTVTFTRRRAEEAGPLGLLGPEDPTRAGERICPYRAVLTPARAHRLPPGHVTEIEMAATQHAVHPDLPAVPLWGFGLSGGAVTSPGPLLEAGAGERTSVRWLNRLPASTRPDDPTRPVPALPFVAVVTPDPDPAHPVQSRLGAGGGVPQDTSMAPVGWTSVHLHGGHSRGDSDGWPDNMAATAGAQLDEFDNTDDNGDLGLGKVGAHLWYHDHAMNGTRFHVYAGLAGGYLVRDPRERQLGLPVRAEDGEIHLLLQDRNITVDGQGGGVRLLHKTTPDTAEFFGPLTLVEGLLWPRVPLRPQVYRLRLLNGSNARTYRLHLVAETTDREHLTVEHDRLLVVGTDGGLLWRPWRPGPADPLVLAPAERLDVLLDLTGLPDGARLHLVNSAPAPFGGDPVPDLEALLRDGDEAGLNPYPWVLRVDVDSDAAQHGQPATLTEALAGEVLNPRFRRLVHDLTDPLPAGEPSELSIEGHEHHTILLAETDPPGHLYLQEIVADPFGAIELQLPGEPLPSRYRVEGWMVDDHSRSDSRVSFYDRIALRPQLGRWQVWRFVNTTGDTHPIHIHQSRFQPLDEAGGLLDITAGPDGPNLYDPTFRRTLSPIRVAADPAGRRFEPPETHGWKDVVRVDPGNVVKVAIRFDVPGRYVYHCHVLEHEDTEMMRPFVVTVVDMNDTPTGHHM